MQLHEIKVSEFGGALKSMLTSNKPIINIKEN